jgi:RNA polymerase sigma-70 factor (ECF subfamily)
LLKLFGRSESVSVDPDLIWFEALFRAYFSPMCSVAFGITGSRDAAEDVTQDVLARVWTDRTRWQRYGTGIEPTLIQSVKNQALSWLRHQRVVAEHAVHPVEAPLSAIHADPLRRAEEAELSVAYRAALKKLPPRRREIFVLSREHGLTYKEIGLRLGVSVKTVEVQMSRALQQMRDELNPFTVAVSLLFLLLLR